MLRLILPLVLQGLLVSGSSSDRCLPGKHIFDPFKHFDTYHIGVHAIRGQEAALREYNLTFSEYLTATAGQRFDPPIKFEIVPYDFEGIFKAIDNEELDFLYASPGIFSCIGTEAGASAIATIVSRLDVRGQVYDLDVFGGVIAVRADNNEINSILDLKDKVIGAGAISMIMAAQLQFYEMERAGLSYVNDPAQVVFTGNQFDVVKGVLNGDFDVGFVRTDTIERTKDDEGNFVDPDSFKIIEPKIFVMDDGSLFPFLHSTDIYPEWPVMAMTHIPKDVAFEVQEALLAISDHAKVGQAYEKCKATNSTSQCAALDFPYDFDPGARCDTTRSLAEMAATASETGSFAGFRPSRSYFQARDMQQAADIMLQDDDGNWRCTRPSTLYAGITCPEGHYKRSEEEFDIACSKLGLECKEGHDCYCKPCVKAFEVDVYQFSVEEEDEDHHLSEHFGADLFGCDKMSICGTTQQGKPITFRIYDNMERDSADVEVLYHAGDSTSKLNVRQPFKGDGHHLYEVTLTEHKVGVEVIEVFFNGKQIPQSPIRLKVQELDCDEQYGTNSQREPDEEGTCVCENNTYEMFGECIQSHFFFLIIFSAVAVGVIILVLVFLNHKRHQSDSVWQINVDELHFNEPPEIIGQGAFGVVVLGQYRGTKVAVKRVIPPTQKRSKGSSVQSSEISGEPKDTKGSKKGSKKGDKDKGDVEAPSDKRGSQKNVSSVINISSNKSWSGFVDPQKYDNALKILEVATSSAHGSYTSGGSSHGSSVHVLTNLLPFCLRYDEHSRQRREFLAEMRLISKLRHPCITTVMGAVVSSSVDPMLVMEYMDYGSLFDLLHNETMYTGGEVILQIVRDIVQGIQFLHASKPPIMHGDLKAKNILVDSRFRAKVADFGFSHIKENKKSNVLQGTPFYMAPEYLRKRTEYNAACDVYSLAMIFYEIYARQEPFEGEDPRKVLPKVCHPRINKRPTLPDACPPKMAEIIKKCWGANPFFRPSAKDLDYILVELSPQDAEPQEKVVSTFKENMTRKPTSLYDVFPKHIADALNAGQKVEAESHEIVTVVFSDIVGFTDISQTFSPIKVSNMLDRLYTKFDDLAKRHKIFKVETIGDAYMGVTNLDGSQFDSHVRCISEYAVDAIAAASKILIDEDKPERGTVQIRLGFHSGPVVSNVIGSLNPRYGLFGDTVNTASRMESNSSPGRILCTHASAKLMETQAPEFPLSPRGKINVKGKGSMMTYWVGNTSQIGLQEMPSFSEVHSEHEELPHDLEAIHSDDDMSHDTGTTVSSSSPESKSSTHQEKAEEKVCWMLTKHLLNLIAARPDGTKRTPEAMQNITIFENSMGHGKTILEEATEYVPIYEGGCSHKNPATISLDKKAEAQLRQYISAIACMHNSNPFHNFDHAVNVMAAAHKLLANIVAPDLNHLALVDDKAFGINNDKLAQFAVVFSALIHDVDHRGIPNFCLAKENHQLNFRYKGKALAEQNAADLGLEILMSPEFDQLRACIYTTEEECKRFRNYVCNIVIATDIFDQDLTKRRNARWERAFEDMNSHHKKLKTLEDVSRQATNVLEHLIQASDISHTMQSWKTYMKWNECLYEEMLLANQQGRFPKDPTFNWYKGEITFMEHTVIPLAKKLDSCGIFGKYGGDFLKQAMDNLEKWKIEGETIVEEMSKRVKAKNGDAIPEMV